MSTSLQQSWSIADIYKLYSDGHLIKSRIQRKKRWAFERIVKFIHFLVSIKNGIMPFLVNEKIVNGAKKFFLFDGNNRSNAVLEFLLAPLLYMNNLVPSQFSESIKRALAKTPLDVLTKHRYTLAKFCREYKLMEYYENSNTKEEDENAFEAMVEKLGSMKFNAITIPVSVFSNLTEKQTSEIYESINTGGVHLTPQELLASSTADIVFTAETLNGFAELVNILNNDYYEEMNKNERLKIDVGSSTNSINLFEILVSSQLRLSKKYTFIPEPCVDKAMDIIFKLYDADHGGFDRHISPQEMNWFLSVIDKGCELIHNNLIRFFNERIGYAGITKCYTVAKKNQCLLMLKYISVALKDGVEMSIIENAVKRVMLYHIILDTFPEGSVPTDSALDVLRYEAGGTFIPKQLQKIKETRKFESVPTDDDIRRMLKFMLVNDIVKYDEQPKQRPKTLTNAKALALSAFYSTHVPIDLLNKPFNNDHIVPHSSKWFEQGVDINRLGNLVLIHEDINKKRGKKPVTDKWIDENGLKYMEYPLEAVYNKVILNDIVQTDAFNAMCEARENIYLEAIMKLL